MLIALQEYRNEERTDDLMGRIAKNLSDDDMKALAAYFSTMPWPAYREPADAASTGFGGAPVGSCSEPRFGESNTSTRRHNLSFSPDLPAALIQGAMIRHFQFERRIALACRETRINGTAAGAVE